MGQLSISLSLSLSLRWAGGGREGYLHDKERENKIAKEERERER